MIILKLPNFLLLKGIEFTQSITSLVIILIVSVFLSTRAYGSELTSKDKLDKINTEISEVQNSLVNISSQRKKLEKSIIKSNNEIKKLQNNISVISKQIKKTENDYYTHERQQKKLEGKELESKKILEKTIVSAFKNSSANNAFKFMLNQENPELNIRLMSYYSAFAKAQTESLENIKITLDQLELNEKELKNTRNNLLQKRLVLAAKKKELSKKQHDQTYLVNKLNSEEKNHYSKLKELKKEQIELNKLIASLTEKTDSEQSDSGGTFFSALPFHKQKGSIPWPVDGKIIHHFKDSKDKLNSINWQGIYFESPEGTRVKSVYPGKVVFADWLKGFGLLLIVDHGSNYMTLYAQNSKLLKKVGDVVQQGEAISLVGKSINSSEVGLYFEIRKKGVPIDPETMLAGK